MDTGNQYIASRERLIWRFSKGNMRSNANGDISYRSARDSKPLEVIGTFNPIPQRPTNLSEQEARTAKAYKEISLDRSRAKYWIGVGAQPSDSVWKLLSLVRCLPLHTSMSASRKGYGPG